MTLRFYDFGDDVKYPSVTSVLSIVPNPGLAAWRESVGPRKANQLSKERAVIGSMTHARILSKYSVKQLELPKIYLPWKDLDEWLEELTYRVEICETNFNELELSIGDCHCEKTLAHSEHGYAGTIDLIGEVNGVQAVADLKTSKQIYDSHLMQLGAYKLMAEFNDYQIDYGLVIKVHPFNDVKPEVRWITKEELESQGEKFLEYLKEFKEKMSQGLCPRCGIKPVSVREEGSDYINEYKACPNCGEKLN